MQSEQSKKHSNSVTDFNFNLKVIIILVAVEVLILVGISFVKIYIDKKHSVLNRMRDEIQILEKIFVDDLDYSTYVLDQMADLIKSNHKDPKRIDDVLSHYSLNVSEKNFFGWHGFYWLDVNNIIKNTNQDCNMSIGTNLSYLSSIRLSKISPGKVFFSQNPNSERDLTTFLDLALGVASDEGEFLGTLFLEIETVTILEDIETYRRNNYTEFAIIDNRMNIVTSYPITSSRIGLAGNTITDQKLLAKISNVNFFDEVSSEESLVNMLSGTNFLIRKIKNKPYVLVVSLDPVHVKSRFTKKVAIKFLEISILASFFLMIILMVYKRETWLRSKAEKASSLATKAMVAKSDFLSYTAHEIRSPLGFILTGSEIMSKKLFGPIPEQYKDYVSGIHHNAKLILDFINDILDEKHVASGNFKIVETICDVEEIIEKAITTNKARFHSRKIKIIKSLDNNIPKILGDSRKILQMLSNLISNSYKYSLDNTSITVRARREGKKLKLSVIDEGIGMSDEEVKVAITKYGTAHSQKTDNFIDSYGLGLPIVIMLAKAHDAVVDIKSEVGKGTEVSIILPEKRLLEKEDEKSND
jgi:signal transduction histidine kinase